MKTASLLLIAMLSFVTTAAQLGKNSISLGPSFSYSLPEGGKPNILKPGPGIDATVQFGVGKRGGVLIQGGIASFKSNEKWTYYDDDKIMILSSKSGYRHFFTPGGFYAHGMIGYDYYTDNEPLSFSVTGGGGRRFAFGRSFFLDAGLDFIDGKTERRLQARLGFGVFPKRSR